MTINFGEPKGGHKSLKHFAKDLWGEFQIDTLCTKGYDQTVHPTPLAKQYASTKKKPDSGALVKDIGGSSGFMFCKICPSCKTYRPNVYFLDVQCHFMRLCDAGFSDPAFTRIGDWSSVWCGDCGTTSKWGQWHDDDMLCRPRETVFRDGSTCFSYRGGHGRVLTAFVARKRKKDGVLIWKKDPERSESFKQKLRAVNSYRMREEATERLLDTPFFEYVKHNMIVRTRKAAAMDALASL